MSTAPNFPTPSVPPPIPFPTTGQPMTADYGAAGTAPDAPGVTWFAQKKTSKAMPMILMVIGIFVMVIGLVLMVKAAGGWIVMIAGVFFLGFGLLLRKNQVSTDVVCDDRGLTIRRTSRKEGPLPPTRIPWSAISGTRCWEVTTEVSSGENGSTTRQDTHFALEANGAVVYQLVEYDLAGFPEFVEHCGMQTSQLLYRWTPKKTAKGLFAIEQAGHFVKVPR